MERVTGRTTMPCWLCYMLYLGSVKALLHSTTCALCSPVLLLLGILYLFSCDDLGLVMLAGLVHGDFYSLTGIIRVAGYNSSAQLAGDSRNMRRCTGDL